MLFGLFFKKKSQYDYFISKPIVLTCINSLTCQTIQNIFDCDHIFDLDLLLYGSPDHGLNINTQIFEAVHIYIEATKRFI